MRWVLKNDSNLENLKGGKICIRVQEGLLPKTACERLAWGLGSDRIWSMRLGNSLSGSGSLLCHVAFIWLLFIRVFLLLPFTSFSQTPHVVFTGVDGEKLKESSQHSLPAFLLAHSTVLAKSLNLSEVLILHLLNEHNYVCRFANNTGKSLLQHEKWL